MGCIHSVGTNKRRISPCNTEIYSSVRAIIDQCPTIVEECSPIVLRYRTPYFRAHAQVVFPPILKEEIWTVGWIQACDQMKFINQYGDLGYSSWEIPALRSRKVSAVSDSDGISYPWYGNTTEIATVVGPTDTYTSMHLTMNDNFYPSVTWDVPVNEGTSAHLSYIVREQSFVTWLAAINETTREIVVLKTIRWDFFLEIYIDPSKELGSRTLCISPRFQNQPRVIDDVFDTKHTGYLNQRHHLAANRNNNKYVGPIPLSALVRPSANYAQTLIWRPSSGKSVTIVPAKEKHKDRTELVLYNNLMTEEENEKIMTKKLSVKDSFRPQRKLK